MSYLLPSITLGILVTLSSSISNGKNKVQKDSKDSKYLSQGCGKDVDEADGLHIKRRFCRT